MHIVLLSVLENVLVVAQVLGFHWVVSTDVGV